MSSLRILKPEDAVEESLGRFIDTAGTFPMQRITRTATSLRQAAFTLSPAADNMFNNASLPELIMGLSSIAKVSRLAATQLIPEAIVRHVRDCTICKETFAGLDVEDSAPRPERLCDIGRDMIDGINLALDDAIHDGISALQH